MQIISPLLLLLFSSTISAYLHKDIKSLRYCSGHSPTTISLLNLFAGNHQIELGKHNESALIADGKWTRNEVKKRRTDCVFKIDSNKSTPGLFVLIKRLHLRKSPNNYCIDFIWLRYSNGQISDKICGDIGLNGDHSALKFFDDPGGIVQVSIHLADYVSMNETEPPLEVSIVFTGYGECYTSSQVMCYPGKDQGCISRSFYKDGIYNCPEPYCADELYCMYRPVEPVYEFNSRNIAISAITSLIFTMAGVGTCIWMCWKYHGCFREYHNDIARESNENRTTNEMPPSFEVSTFSPTAPEEAKDPPPSYESLFPSR